MRKTLMASLVLVLSLVPLQSADARRSKKPARVRTLTFNIRYDFKNDGQNRWQHRVGAVAKQIQEIKPHVVCLQEDKAHQVEDLKPLLKRYAFLGRGRNATGSGERCSILYDKKFFKAKSHGDFWLSDTPSKPGSNTWGDKYPRKVTWALLEAKKGRSQLLVLNTHLTEGKDGRAWNLRTKGVEAIRSWLLAKVGGKSKKSRKKRSVLNVVVMGDYNSAEDSKPYKVLTSDTKLRLRDAWVEARPSDAHPGTYSGFRGLTTNDRIDWILVRGNVRVNQAGKLDKKIDGRWPSDHYPVFAELDIR
ncbi:MAG: endonuclease/exonuclease/phosphatase family protein [Planctomycetes bacterium]|nr:endonuclease/exonuclease/phosphatase family protein [Planctomycetota bacterium]